MASQRSLKIILDAWLERGLGQLGDDEVRKKALRECYAIIREMYRRVEALPPDKQFEVITHPCGAVTQRCGVERVGAV